MIKRTIDVNDWLFGEEEESFLFRPRDNKRCCLGQFACAVGIPDSALENIGVPNALINTVGIHYEQYPDYFKPFATLSEDTNRFSATHFAWAAMTINDKALNPTDGTRMNLLQRIKKLQALAHEHGEDWEFINVPDNAHEIYSTLSREE